MRRVYSAQPQAILTSFPGSRTDRLCARAGGCGAALAQYAVCTSVWHSTAHTDWDGCKTEAGQSDALALLGTLHFD